MSDPFLGIMIAVTWNMCADSWVVKFPINKFTFHDKIVICHQNFFTIFRRFFLDSNPLAHLLRFYSKNPYSV